MNLETVRAVVKSLRGRSVHPKNGGFIGYSLPELRDGIVWFGAVAAMHPATFLDTFGINEFRTLKRDCSKAKIEKFIAKWRNRRDAQ